MSLSNIWKLRAENSPLYHMFMSFVGWFLVFLAGVAIPSQPYRDIVVNSSFGLTEVVSPTTTAKPPSAQSPAPAAASDAPSPVPAPQQARMSGLGLLLIPLLILVIGISYTPSNLVLLCCFGAMLGSYAIRSLAEANATPHGQAPLKEVVHVPPLTAMLHGLCVYLGMVGGLIVVQGQVAFDSKDPNMYLRLSAVATLFSVIAGTNRHFIHDIAVAFTPFSRATGEQEREGKLVPARP